MATAILNGNKTVTATAKQKTYSITCGNGGTGQTLTVTVAGFGTLTNGGSFTVPYGTEYTAEVTASEGYDAGTVSSTSGTVTGAVNITVTTATKKTYSVTVGSHPYCNVNLDCAGFSTVTNGTMADVPYGSVVTATAAPDSGYKVDSINFN